MLTHSCCVNKALLCECPCTQVGILAAVIVLECTGPYERRLDMEELREILTQLWLACDVLQAPFKVWACPPQLHQAACVSDLQCVLDWPSSSLPFLSPSSALLPKLLAACCSAASHGERVGVLADSGGHRAAPCACGLAHDAGLLLQSRARRVYAARGLPACCFDEASCACRATSSRALKQQTSMLTAPQPLWLRRGRGWCWSRVCVRRCSSCTSAAGRCWSCA